MSAYDVDLHDWALAQADAIRRRSANEMDWDNIAEEVESLGRSQRSALRSHLTILLLHLLKWERQPERRGRSWRDSVREARLQIPAIVADSPSLRPWLPQAFAEAYDLARLRAAIEMDVDDRDLPQDAPFTLEQALDPAWPSGLAAWEPDGR